MPTQWITHTDQAGHVVRMAFGQGQPGGAVKDAMAFKRVQL